MTRIVTAKVVISAAIALLLIVSATGAQAGVIVGDRMYFDNYNFSQGGSFTAEPVSPSTWKPFKTFCVQMEQHIYVNSGSSATYQVESIGLSNDTPGNPLSINSHVAWLYTAFEGGTLPGFVNDSAHEAAVQYGVWHSVGYSDADITAEGFGFYVQPGGAKDLYDNLHWDITPQTWSGLSNVRVAQMEDLSGNPAQDVLVAANVPEPATLTLLAVGGLIALRRRNRIKAAL